jgi:hypothetical protein
MDENILKIFLNILKLRTELIKSSYDQLGKEILESSLSRFRSLFSFLVTADIGISALVVMHSQSCVL